MSSPYDIVTFPQSSYPLQAEVDYELGIIQSPAALVYSVYAVGAKFDGVTDGAPAINAALASGAARVVLPHNATAKINSTIVIPNGVSLEGGNTILRAGAALNPMITMERTGSNFYGNRNGRVIGITCDGNNVATEGIYLGLVVCRTFIDAQVIKIVPQTGATASSNTNVQGCAWVLDRSQNNTFITCGTDQNCGVALAILNWAAGNTFINGEMCFGSLKNLFIGLDTTRYNYTGNAPIQNTIQGTRFEYGAPTDSVHIAAGVQNQLIDCVCVGDGSGGSQIRIDSGASYNAFIRPKMYPGNLNNGGITQNGFQTILEDIWIESFPASTTVLKIGGKTIIRGLPHLSDGTFQWSNTSGNVGQNVSSQIPTVIMGPDDISQIASYTQWQMPGMRATNDTGRTWVYGKTGWYEQQQTPVDSIIYLAAAGAGATVTGTYQLSSTLGGSFELDVIANSGDDNHGRQNRFQVVFSSNPSVNKPTLVSKVLSADNVWGSIVTALSATVSTSGLVTISVTFGSATTGHLHVNAYRTGFVSSTG